MIQITDNEIAAQAKYEIAQALLNALAWQFWEGEKLLSSLTRESCEFSVEWGKLIFARWDHEQSQSWRVTAYEINEAEIRFQATRGMGREIVNFTLRDPVRWQAVKAQDLSVIERRAKFSELLTEIICAHFAEARVQRVSVRSKNSTASPGQYVRLWLKLKKENMMAIGINESEKQADFDGIIAAGLASVSEFKQPVTRLWLCVPKDHNQTILERLTLLDTTQHNFKIECFEINENDRAMISLRPFSQAELLSLHPRGLIWPEQKTKLRSIWRERILRLAPKLIEVREDVKQSFESFSIHGLEFARTYDAERERVKFGVASYTDEIAEKFYRANETGRKILSERNFAELEKLTREIIAHRRADTPDLRHPFYRLRTESWLESLLRRDIRVLDATLDPCFVYSQIPAWLGEERSVLDLLTINHEGRVVVIEIKAAEDAQLPLQGLDYWLRVEQARIRGEFARRGLFAGIALADKSPLLYLVAPRLRFHRSFNLLANCLAPEVEAYQIGLNSNWRAGVKVNSKEQLGISIAPNK